MANKMLKVLKSHRKLRVFISIKKKSVIDFFAAVHTFSPESITVENIIHNIMYETK